MAAGDLYASNHLAAGQVAGTGALLTIICGFKPKAIYVQNRTQLADFEWGFGMPDASAYKQVTAGTKSFVTSNAITPLFNGFSLGTDAALNTAADIIYWQAFK